MEIKIEATRSYARGDCVICKHEGVCKIFDAVRSFPLSTEITFDCPHAGLEEEK